MRQAQSAIRQVGTNPARIVWLFLSTRSYVSDVKNEKQEGQLHSGRVQQSLLLYDITPSCDCAQWNFNVLTDDIARSFYFFFTGTQISPLVSLR